MKKKIYSVCLFAVMGLISVQAQGLMKPKAKAVPEKAMTSSKTLPELVRTDQMRTVDAAEIEGQTVKKILPVAFLHSDGAEAGPEGKISYDLQGNISQSAILMRALKLLIIPTMPSISGLLFSTPR